MLIKIDGTRTEEGVPLYAPRNGMYSRLYYQGRKGSPVRVERKPLARVRNNRVIISALLNVELGKYRGYETESRYVFVPVRYGEAPPDALVLTGASGADKHGTKSFGNTNLALHIREENGITDPKDKRVIHFLSYSEEGMIFIDKTSAIIVDK